MNLISTYKISGKTIRNLSLAGSLFLHVGLISLISSWQWEWNTPEKNSSKIITIKFISASPPSNSNETPDLQKRSPMVPAQPLTTRSISESNLMPRTPNLSTPTLQTVSMARLMVQPHQKIMKRPLAQSTSFKKINLSGPSAPENSTESNQRPILHRRIPTAAAFASKIPDAPTQAAVSTGPATPKLNIIRRRPDNAQRKNFLQAGIVSQPEVEQRISKISADDQFVAFPRKFPQSPSADHNSSGADLSAVRGLFTGKVRQRIANAKYYPRVARRRGMEGQPIIAFTLGRDGRLMEIDLAKTSGYQLLDQAALEAVHQAAPYPKIPASLEMDSFQFKLPISFVLK